MLDSNIKRFNFPKIFSLSLKFEQVNIRSISLNDKAKIQIKNRLNKIFEFTNEHKQSKIDKTIIFHQSVSQNKGNKNISIMAESLNNYRSANLVLEQAKTQVQTDYHPVSRRISTEHVAIDYVPFTQVERKSLNNFQLPSIESARVNHTVPLSQKLHVDVERLIEDQITKSKVSVPQAQSPIKLQIKRRKKQKPFDPELQMKLKMKEIQTKRQEAIIMLKTIEEKETQIKRKSVSIKFNQQNLSRCRIKKERSHYSPQEKRAVKKILMRKSMLEQQLNQKTMNFKTRHLMEVQTQRQRLQTQIEKEKSLHRSFIEQNKPIVEQKKLQRFRSIESGNKKYQQVKSKRYFYQTIEENDQKLAMQELEQLNKKLQTIKTKMRVTIVEELKEHKEKYNEIMKSRTQANSIKKNAFVTETNNSQVRKYEQNYYTKLAREEREQKRKEEEMAKSKLFELKKKAKQFSEHCNAQIRPKIKITSKSKFVPAQATKSTYALNYKDQLKKGNEYLTVAKKLKKCQTLEDQKVLSNRGLQSVQRKPQKSTYKNYLTEMRRMSESNPEQSERKKFSNFLQKQGTISEYNTLEKAFVKAESIQAISKKSKNQKLIDAVQNKIELLKMII